MATWQQNVAEAIEVAYGREMTPEDERFVRVVMDGFKYRAEDRALLAFIASSDTKGRYAHDAEFHAAVQLLVRVFVSGVFGELPLTEREMEERRKAMDKMVSILMDLR